MKAITLFIGALFITLVAARVHPRDNWSVGGPGGGGGGGAGSANYRGENGQNGGGVGGGEGGQGGWGGPVSQGTDAMCETVARYNCPTTKLLPNIQDCGSYCQCENAVGKFMPCAGGLHFSKQLQRCEWPGVANCPYN